MADKFLDQYFLSQDNGDIMHTYVQVHIIIHNYAKLLPHIHKYIPFPNSPIPHHTLLIVYDILSYSGIYLILSHTLPSITIPRIA